MKLTTLNRGSRSLRSSRAAASTLADALLARTRLREEPAANLFYYSAFAVYSLKTFLGRTMFERVLFFPVDEFGDLLVFPILFLLIMKLAFQRSSLLGWMSAAVAVLVGFVSWRQSGEGWFFWLLLFVVCGDGVRLRKLAAISLAITGALASLTVLCAQTGLVENVVRMRADGTLRYSMGFVHPNSFGLALLMLCTSFTVLRFGRNPVPSIVLLCIAVVLCMGVANSRTTALLSVVQAALLLVFHAVKSEQARRAWATGLTVAVAVGLFFSLYMMFFYDAANPLQASLDGLLSGRLRLAHAYYAMGSLTLFGNDYQSYAPIYWERGEPKQFLVDNAFCHVLLRWGLVPGALFFVGYALLFFVVLRQRRWDAVFFGLVLMSFYCLSETMGLKIECNYLLVAAAPLVFYGNAGAWIKHSVSSPDGHRSRRIPSAVVLVRGRGEINHARD